MKNSYSDLKSVLSFCLLLLMGTCLVFSDGCLWGNNAGSPPNGVADNSATSSGGTTSGTTGSTGSGGSNISTKDAISLMLGWNFNIIHDIIENSRCCSNLLSCISDFYNSNCSTFAAKSGSISSSSATPPLTNTYNNYATLFCNSADSTCLAAKDANPLVFPPGDVTNGSCLLTKNGAVSATLNTATATNWCASASSPYSESYNNYNIKIESPTLSLDVQLDSGTVTHSVNKGPGGVLGLISICDNIMSGSVGSSNFSMTLSDNNTTSNTCGLSDQGGVNIAASDSLNSNIALSLIGKFNGNTYTITSSGFAVNIGILQSDLAVSGIVIITGGGINAICTFPSGTDLHILTDFTQIEPFCTGL